MKPIRLSCMTCDDTGGMAYAGSLDEPPGSDICPEAQGTGHDCPTCGEEIYCCNRPLQPGERSVGLCGNDPQHVFDLLRNQDGDLVLEPFDQSLASLPLAARQAHSTLSHIQTTCGGPSWSAPKAAKMCRDAMRALESAGIF